MREGVFLLINLINVGSWKKRLVGEAFVYSTCNGGTEKPREVSGKKYFRTAPEVEEKLVNIRWRQKKKRKKKERKEMWQVYFIYIFLFIYLFIFTGKEALLG